MIKLGYLAALFTLVLTASISDALENDCAIIATEANAKLTGSAVWSQVLLVEFFNTKTFKAYAHAITVWQIHVGGAILCYDSGGTLEMHTHSREWKDIVSELNKNNQQQLIFTAHYVQ